MAELLVTCCCGIRCDKRNCKRELTGVELRWFEGLRHYTKLAHAAGWTCWVGRSRRWYCPDHKPGAAHRMREVTGD